MPIFTGKIFVAVELFCVSDLGAELEDQAFRFFCTHFLLDQILYVSTVARGNVGVDEGLILFVCVLRSRLWNVVSHEGF